MFLEAEDSIENGRFSANCVRCYNVFQAVVQEGGETAGMTNMAIASRRMIGQRIAGASYESPEAVVRGMGAMQAQDYMQAVWGIGLRTVAAKLTDVERAIAERKIVLTWSQRGTLHLMPAEDVKWMLDTCAPRIVAQDKRRMAQLGLDENMLAVCGQLIRDALAGDRRETRAGIMALLEQAGIPTGNQRGYHIMWRLGQSGLICFGPMEGKQQTFVLLDEWVRRFAAFSREEALAELALRYFTGHGPATLHDLAWWTGLTIADAKLGLENVQDKLQMVTAGGERYWMGPDYPESGTCSGIRLLPGFDEYILGYKDRSAVLSPEHAALIVPGNNGVFLPTVVDGGQVVGTWKREIKKNHVAVRLQPFGQAGEWEAEAEAEMRRFGEFIGLPVTVMTN